MASKVEEAVDGVADRLMLVIQQLDVTPSVTPAKWAVNPGAGFDSVPGAVIEIPTIGRSEVDGNEDHLGQRDLHLNYQVLFVFDASDVSYTMPQSVEAIAAFIDAVDLTPTLGLDGTVQEAKVTNAEPTNVENEGRPLYGYLCTVEVLAFL